MSTLTIFQIKNEKNLAFAFILLFSASCNEEISQEQPDYGQLILQMQEMHYSNLEFAFENLESSLRKQKRKLILNERKLVKNTFEGDQGRFFELGSFDTESFFNSFEEQKIIEVMSAARISSYDLTNYADFTPAQKMVG